MSLDSPSRRPDDLVETIRDLDRRLRALESANRLTRASVGSGGLRILNGGSLTISGNLTVSGTSDLEGPLTLTDDLTVSTNGDILVDGGDIQVKSSGSFASLAGIDAEELNAKASGFEVSTTKTDIVSHTLTRPSWATTAVCMVVGVCSAGNDTGAQDTLWVQTLLETDDGQTGQTGQYQDTKLDGQQAQGTVPQAEVFDMSAGATTVTGTLQIEAKNNTWSADAQNQARIDGVVIWLGQPSP